MNDVPPPLDALLELGEERAIAEDVDYRGLGIGPEHVPDLIAMATDPSLMDLGDREDDDQAMAWAPDHAIHALVQLGAIEAAGPLLDATDRMVAVTDFWESLLVDAFEAFGPPALPACEARIADPERSEAHRMTIGEVVARIGSMHPDHRDACVAMLSEALGLGEANTPVLNGFLIANLLELNAAEAAPTIEAAFKAGVVDETIAGNWPIVRHELGLGPEPPELRAIRRRVEALERGRGPVRPPRPPRSRPDFKKLAKRGKQSKKRRPKPPKRGGR